MIEELQGKHYIWRTADSCEELIHFALAPSVVLQMGKWHAFWLLEDAPPEPQRFAFTAGGRRPHVVRCKLNLKYKYRDFEAANRVPEETVQRILAQPETSARRNTERELEVIATLRKCGMSSEGIKAIFQEQAIGDPYRDIGSMLGSLTMVDELTQDIVQHYETAGFHYNHDGVILWFNLASVLRWWYPKRRGDGLRALPQKEMAALLNAQAQKIGSYILSGGKKWHANVCWRMHGIDLEIAKGLGVIRGE